MSLPEPAPLASPSPAVILRDLCKRFDGREILGGIDLDIPDGQFVSLLGASGTGKTTLLRILAGLERIDGGTAQVAAERSVVFQEPRLVLARRVWQNVVLSQGFNARSRHLAETMLAQVGLAAQAGAWPRTLSGGEAQRVALARALVTAPRLMLLDEPFGALDYLTRLNMHVLLETLCAALKPAVVLVTHDVDEAITLSDRIVVLGQGRIQLDLSLNTPKPRPRSDTTVIALRARLLAALGADPAHG